MDIDIKKIIQNQPTINIGMLGHVANGKTSIIKAITDILTIKHSDEKQRGITIKIGYANAKIYKCPKSHKSESKKRKIIYKNFYIIFNNLKN